MPKFLQFESTELIWRNENFPVILDAQSGIRFYDAPISAQLAPAAQVASQFQGQK